MRCWLLRPAFPLWAARSFRLSESLRSCHVCTASVLCLINLSQSLLLLTRDRLSTPLRRRQAEEPASVVSYSKRHRSGGECGFVSETGLQSTPAINNCVSSGRFRNVSKLRFRNYIKRAIAGRPPSRVTMKTKWMPEHESVAGPGLLSTDLCHYTEGEPTLPHAFLYSTRLQRASGGIHLLIYSINR